MAMRTFPSESRAKPVQTSRSCAAGPQDLAQIYWLSRLDVAERTRGGRPGVVADLRVVMVEPGECVCRIGRPVAHWFGVVDGLLKMSNDSTSTA